MADTVSGANKRQSARRKPYYKAQYDRTIRNKILRLKRVVRQQPDNLQAQKALEFWEQHKVDITVKGGHFKGRLGEVTGKQSAVDKYTKYGAVAKRVHAAEAAA